MKRGLRAEFRQEKLFNVGASEFPPKRVILSTTQQVEFNGPRSEEVARPTELILFQQHSPTRLRISVSFPMDKSLPNGHEHDFDVQPEGPIFNIVHIMR